MIITGKWRFHKKKREEKKKRQGKQMCNSIKSHLAEVMQFQVQDQALCLFSPLITNTSVFCYMQLLWGKKTKQNSIHLSELSVEYCVCYTKTGD